MLFTRPLKEQQSPAYPPFPTAKTNTEPNPFRPWYLNKKDIYLSSRLDNCNSLLFGLFLYQIERLQRIQNTAARVVTLSSIKEHITPILNDLHWLTIHNRIKFKLLLLTYKVLNGFAPTYLSELIQPYKNQRNLRSNNQYLLRVPKSRTTTFGDRAFSVCAPKLWNNLPTDVKVVL